MHFEHDMIFRPPSEANSILMQVTTGCSHNKCTFCGTYKDIRFKIKSDDIIEQDIEYAARHYPAKRRMFLCDGDALIIPHKRLAAILERIKLRLPRITRVGVYANAKSLKLKTIEELKALHGLGLGIVYLGIESGDNETLVSICKGATAEDMVLAGLKAKAAGIKLSVMVLLGIAGRKRSLIHAAETGRVLTEINPDYVGALTLMLIPGTPLYRQFKNGDFKLPDPKEMLKELRNMLACTHMTGGQFYANHASNFLPIKARMPKDKQSSLRRIDDALSGKITLRPEGFRGL